MIPKWLQKAINATIKASIADAPAVAAASGWTIDSKTGEAQQNATEDPGVQQLRENLASFSLALDTVPIIATSFGVAGPVAADIVNTGFAIDSARRLASDNGIKRTYNLVKDKQYGPAVLSALGDVLDASGVVHTAGLLNRIGKAVKAGSSVKNAYTSDLAGRLLAENVRTTSNPQLGPLRHVKKYDLTPQHSTMGISEYELFDTGTGRSIGKLGTTYDNRINSNGIQSVDNIIGSEGTRGVSRALYNAALGDKTAGLISGENLVHPEITERVWKHFPREVIGNRGYRPSETGTVNFGDVVRLKKPESFIPIINNDSVFRFNIRQPRYLQEGKTYHVLTERPTSLSISERAGIPKSLRDKVNPTNYLQSQGFSLPRKHLQGDDAVKMFKEYGTVEIPENAQLIDQLRKYIPEVRERYGLVGNANITDDEIIGSLYKRVSENSDLPIVGFRGDTKRYNQLIPQSVKDGDSPDNILGRMTLDDISETNRYLYTYAPDLFFDGGYKFTPPYQSIGAENALGIGRKSNLQIVDTWSRYGQSAPVFKVPAEKTPTGVNDINAFIFKPKTKIVDFDPARTSDGAIDIDYANQILGKLDGNSIIRIKKAPTLEHDANYYIIPNDNLLSAKHLLPFDFRIDPQWNSRIIYRKQGGIISAQKGKKIKYPTSTTSAFLSGTMDYLLRRDNPKSFIKSEYKPTVGDNGETYYTRDGLKNEVALSLFGGTDSNKQFLGQNYFYKDFDDAYNQLSVHNDSRHTSNGTLGNYAASAGQDDRGRYLSFSDKFDFVMLPGKPIHIYDRIYEDELDQLYDKNDSAVNLGDSISKAPKFKQLKENGGTLKYQKGKL